MIRRYAPIRAFSPYGPFTYTASLVHHVPGVSRTDVRLLLGASARMWREIRAK